MADVEEWQVREVVTLLGEHLGHAGSELAVPTGRTLTVKARRRDDATVNVWVDRRRASLPRCVSSSLSERRFDTGGVDVVVESGPDDAAVNGLVLTVLEAELPAAPDRTEECRRAADALGLDRLDRAGPDAILRIDDDVLKARTRHVITEVVRVRAARRALDEQAWAQLGTILTASHESLRDDFDVTRAELDVAAEAAVEAGALGARLHLALVPHDRADAVRELVQSRFEAAGWARPEIGMLPVPETMTA